YFEPILRYIKGYVADGSGRAVGGAEVSIRLKMNNAIYSTIKANEDGFIEIPSNKLPLFSYYIEIKAPNSSIRLTKNPSTFAKENEDYLVSEKINLMKDQNMIEKEKLNNENQNGEKIGEIKKVKNLTNLSPVNKMIVIIVIIIFLLVASAVLLLFHIKRQK
ncbi:MAG: carboxypeptidase-like regulatory domain-containing protein, partial [Candidatus Roizmanbacteria bacterium]|nr:carboxypeptidase-like regulatory domain-containing protein [Candidatus Roizmanbacteria bacterium]